MSGGWLEADKDVESPGVALGCAAGRFFVWALKRLGLRSDRVFDRLQHLANKCQAGGDVAIEPSVRKDHSVRGTHGVPSIGVAAVLLLARF